MAMDRMNTKKNEQQLDQKPKEQKTQRIEKQEDWIKGRKCKYT